MVDIDPGVSHYFANKTGEEVFNGTLRQRVSRLVRKSLAFSKNEWFHEEAIKYFIAHYNLECQKLFEQYF